ncbi:methionyl-tRNA formyltransferase [Opitutaceae bacterium]
MSALRLVFMGSDPIALPFLEWLVGEGAHVATVVAVFTQPDRPVGRGQKITANGIKLWAQARGIPVQQPDKVTEPVRQELAAYQADLALVMAYGHILRDEVIATPRLGTFNLHTSILPAYRGASPIQTAVACGERETGVTFMRIVRQLDAGPVIDVERVTIVPTDSALDVEGKLSAACVPLVARVLPRIAAGMFSELAQDGSRATFCRRLAKEDGVLDFNAPAAVLAARINGLFPWPACSVAIAGQPVKFGQAIEEHGAGDAGSPGTVLTGEPGRLLIATGQGVLEVLRLQRPGGKMLAAREFLRGFAIVPGTVLPSVPMPPLVGDVPFRT